MGYLTDYTVRIVEGDEATLNEVIAELTQVSNYDFYEIPGSGEAFVGDVKWYVHEDDMRYLSEQFPSLLLEVEGRGEDHNDIWAQRFRNGAADAKVKAVVTFPGLARPERALPSGAPAEGQT